MSEDHQPVDQRPGWLIAVQAEGTSVGTLLVDGKEYRYTTVRRGLEPSLPYVVGFLSEAALFISEDAPPEDRPFILTHEVREKARFAPLPEEQRCQASLRAELDDVKAQAPERLVAYVAGRRNFFDALVTYYQRPDQAAAKTPLFIEGIGRSQAYLHNLDLASVEPAV